MSKKISSLIIREKLVQLMGDEEGLLTLLTGSLLLTDFENFDEALKEALAAFNNNRRYFDGLQKRWSVEINSLPPSQDRSD